MGTSIAYDRDDDPLSFQSLLEQLGLMTSNNVLWDFPKSVLACFLSFFFALFCAVSCVLLWSDFKSSFALIRELSFFSSRGGGGGAGGNGGDRVKIID